MRNYYIQSGVKREHYNKDPRSPSHSGSFMFTTIKRVNNTEIDWACSTNGRDENSYTILLGKPEGNIPLWTPRSKWKDIKIYIIEIEYEGVYWI
jgi:hypothetical protein